MAHKSVIKRIYQGGQAAVLANLFLLIMVVAALGMYKSGKITTDKMQLQNAADAAAYSMALTEARDLNFAAYMNRAIVANEVAIGQLVGLASWAFHFTSFADYLDSYNTYFLGPATLGVSTGVITPITAAWRTVGNTGITVMSKIADIGTKVLHNINKIYGLAEYGYHTVSVIFAIGVLNDVIEDNGPEGAKISDFGFIGLIAHIATYGALPGLPGDQFSESYNPTKAVPEDEFEDSGYARLSALVRDGRDPFTKGEGDKLCLPSIPGLPQCSSFVAGRGWELRPPGFPVDISTPDSPPFVVDAGIIAYEFKLSFRFDLSLERKGASELRVVIPASGGIKGTNLNWSSADSTGLFFELGAGGSAKIELLPEPFRFTIFNAAANFLIADSRMKVFVSFGDTDPDEVQANIDECVEENEEIQADNDADDDTSNDQELYDCSNAGGDGFTLVDVPFPTSAPFSSGFAEAGKMTPNNLKLNHMTLAPLGPVETEHYGEAANNLAAWVSPGPGGPTFPLGIQASSDLPFGDTKNRVNKSYAGLPRYVDTTGNESYYGIGAPNILIGLVLDEDDFDQNSAGTGVEDEPVGEFQLTEGFADNEIAAIAKGQLYFSRPTDVSHFARLDGQEEYGSAFNPYWQARLIDTDYADRVLALFIQQKANFVNLGASLQTAFGNILQYLPGTP